jgi:hypothetical protein
VELCWMEQIVLVLKIPHEMQWKNYILWLIGEVD